MRQLGINWSFYQRAFLLRDAFIIVVLAMAGSLGSTASAQCELQTIWSPDGGGPDFTFGISAAGSATMDVIVLGEPGRDNLTGAAYIYRLIDSQWQLEEMFVAEDGPQIGAQFGVRIDMSADGKTVLISELKDANNGFFNAGAVWVYVEVGGKWVVQQKLTASDAENSWLFGEKLALSADGNVAAISATGAPGRPVYVFTREGDSWTESAKLDGDSAFAGLPWIDVSADGGVIAVGATDDADQAVNAGATHIFVRSNGQGPWLFRQKIYASDALTHDHFGRDVALSATGDTILIGAGGVDEAASSGGAVYIFQRRGELWFEQVKILASDPQTQDHFGSHNKLTPDGERAIIRSSNGSCYVFDFIDNQWVETMRLVASDLNVKGLGKAIAITDDGSTTLLGAPNSSVDGVLWYGAASLFDLEAPLGDSNCDRAITIADLLALFSNWGPCSDCEFLNGCPGDINLDCTVNINDLLILFSNWG